MCDSDVDYDFDQLVSCDACGITVHQSCYGVPEAPGPAYCLATSRVQPALLPFTTFTVQTASLKQDGAQFPDL